MANIAKLYAAGQKRHLFTAKEVRDGMDRVSPVAADVPLMRSDIVIEAAVEKMEIKKQIFRALDRVTREDAILATNTSALSITELASATKHPSRVVGIHFFNPVHQMQLVEVIVGRETAPEVVQRAVAFTQAIGKLPVVVKDSPGFVVNRVLLPYMVEAVKLFASGVDPKEIDEAMLDFGMPMGPLRLIDEVGVDIAEDVARTLAAAFPDRMNVPPILAKMLAAGLLGRKAGKGFYIHKKGSDAEKNSAVLALRDGGKANIARTELQKRMVLLMVNEAARCLEEAIVEDAADIDFAMVMGTGFAPFRGGPLRYADAVGVAAVVADLERLRKEAGPQFAPSALLLQKAADNKPIYED
jgi:3-hydroxyacyl-CoA dehydrogenase/enoyl-CoA hydratase/3-hydroxybutyryl-CoA epimerase